MPVELATIGGLFRSVLGKIAGSSLLTGFLAKVNKKSLVFQSE
jgi:hypothetical protein